MSKGHPGPPRPLSPTSMGRSTPSQMLTVDLSIMQKMNLDKNKIDDGQADVVDNNDTTCFAQIRRKIVSNNVLSTETQ